MVKSPKKFLLLGLGGFIGSHLVGRLMTDPTLEVVGVDPCVTKIQHLLDRPNLKIHQRYLDDVLADGTLEAEIREADIVINLAAICNPAEYNTRPLATIKSNLFDAIPVVDLCAKYNTWVIQFSTCEIYGRTLSSYIEGDNYSDPALYVQNEETTPLVMGPIANQRWSYAASKTVLERYVYALGDEMKMPYTVIRPYNFFGPKMDFIPGRDGDGVPRVLACFMTALLDREPMKLVDGGNAFRTITSIHDAIDSMMLMVEKPEQAQFRIFNIGNKANELTVAELAERMRVIYAEVSGDPTYRDHPIEAVTSGDFYGKGYEDCDRRVPDIGLAETLLGWKPQHGIDGILRETIQYYYDAYSEKPRQLRAG